jgi:hypothetical protein
MLANLPSSIGATWADVQDLGHIENYMSPFA